MSLQPLANSIRALSMDAVQQANCGHPGMPMGMADVATVLYTKFLKHCPNDPAWADRDRFVLSAGHGSMLLYSLLHLTGYEDFPIEELKKFRTLHARTAGHPEYGHGQGIETTTGPLGQGFSNGVGMALAEMHLQAKFGKDLVDHYTYVIAGDGCLMEGISYEAAALAGHLKLNKLIVLWDDNGITIDGKVSMSSSEDQLKRFQAAGWHTLSCDGHNFADIELAIAEARKSSDKPVLISCKTIIGKGSPNKQGSEKSHGAVLGEAEVALVREQLNWHHAPFVIPAEIKQAWEASAEASKASYQDWQSRLAQHPDKTEFQRRMQGALPNDLDQVFETLKQQYSQNDKAFATRQSAQIVLNDILEAVPELLGGSADLTGSNLTKGNDQAIFNADNRQGRYVYYGIREHGMAGTMNGIALHGGLIPYGGTFLVFTDYCRPSIRLAALMGIKVIYIMTHDSIGLGEDGPTHQPVETINALRAIPNLMVLRPCDTVETAECWQLALENNQPTVIALSRQGLPLLRQTHCSENKSKQGAYPLVLESKDLQVSIMATGSEVAIAVAAQQTLEAQGFGCRVISTPCLSRFSQLDASERADVLGDYCVLASIEAGSTLSWRALAERPQVTVGIDQFGASGSIEALYEHYGLTAQHLVDQIKAKL